MFFNILMIKKHVLDSKSFFDTIINVVRENLMSDNRIELRAFSSVGRASPLQGEGQKFESFNAHHKKDRLGGLF